MMKFAFALLVASSCLTHKTAVKISQPVRITAVADTLGDPGHFPPPGPIILIKK